MNIAEKLSREIERVTILRATYVLVDSLLNKQGAVPTIAIMTAAIETGHTAAGSGDAHTIAQALRTLEGFRL